MTISTYRDWIGHVRVSLAEFVGAKTNEMKFIEALRVAHNVKVLIGADCLKASDKIRKQAAFWIKRAKERLKEEGFDKIVKQWDSQDVMITNLAFAEDQR